MLLGLRSLIFAAPDLDAAKAWWTSALGVEPYFDEPFYVGFQLGGHELGLDPHGSERPDGEAYWGVADLDAAVTALRAAGAELDGDVRDVGDGIRMARLLLPTGQVLGLIRNPHTD